MLESAIRRRFPVDCAKAAETVNEHLGSDDERIAMRAASIAALMESLNQKDEHKLVDVHIQQRDSELDAIAAELGVEAHLIADATRKSGGGDSSAQGTQSTEPANRAR